ncbi:hypothetical protein [[Eubacterium] cellulosolvens]
MDVPSEPERAAIVALIIDRQPEEALKRLSLYYKVTPPKLCIGRVKRHSNSLAVYQSRKKAIYVSNRNYLYTPQILLHEFYHHLRSIDGSHRGNEKYADKFAQSFLISYSSLVSHYRART